MDGVEWFEVWQETRVKLQLPMRRPDEQSYNRLLGKTGCHGGPVRTHSLKVTLHSWSAKTGIDHDPRRLLGYHVAPMDKSMLAYSRDAISGPLRRMERVMALTREGRFKPHETRSGRVIHLDE
eukprot:6407956-Amphidinium_carterae.1